MSAMLDATAQAQVFTAARSRNGWTGEQVSEALMRQVYDLMKWGPTSANCSPARFVFVHTAEGKERLKPHLSAGNLAKTMAAPCTVIVATDPKFYDRIPELFPHLPSARDWFAQSPDGGVEAGFRNGTLQGAYLMVAARMLGLDCGPMSGFDMAGVDAEFLAADGWKSNFLCNIGYGTDENLFPRLPRLAFEDACRVV